MVQHDVLVCGLLALHSIKQRKMFERRRERTGSEARVKCGSGHGLQQTMVVCECSSSFLHPFIYLTALLVREMVINPDSKPLSMFFLVVSTVVFDPQLLKASCDDS
jgi:hypothetical protein